MRQIILDTETTGLKPEEGHRIIEIGAIEIVYRMFTHNDFHQYINPGREVEFEALKVHGITNEFLADKPKFVDVANEFLRYIEGAELIIHNAPFDVGFLDYELRILDKSFPGVASDCSIVDTLTMARKMYPGKKNSLDALCKRHGVDNSNRDYHGALLDARLLADVYLLMTGGQMQLFGDSTFASENEPRNTAVQQIEHTNLLISEVSAEELELHKKQLVRINELSDGKCLWLGDD
ncbi:MAG: DNA polymerase III subunit epsilon [Gammaproteobacteria bacterium]|nr:DNA polymerase III subunit epsilon [Gammaproteobacteria bacterium]